MKVNIDTKEKFTVITPLLANFNDNVTGELVETITNCLLKECKNVILNLSNISELEPALTDSLVKLREQFYNNNASFVTCCPNKEVLRKIKELELEEALNLTLTESEAWDIVQMDEIEREFEEGEADL